MTLDGDNTVGLTVLGHCSGNVVTLLWKISAAHLWKFESSAGIKAAKDYTFFLRTCQRYYSVDRLKRINVWFYFCLNPNPHGLFLNDFTQGDILASCGQKQK